MKGSIRLAGALLSAAILNGCAEQGPPPPPPGAVPAGQPIGSGEIAGMVTFVGAVPPPEVINMSSDGVCQSRSSGQTREDIVVGAGGGTKNVFVHVASGLSGRVFAPPKTAVTLDQRGCTYRPRVVGVQVNQPLEIINSDPTLHNVHSMPAGNQPFNVGMPVEGMRVRKWFTRPEVMVRMKCDLHNWMTAWVGVVDHPFHAVSGEDGRFALRGLPAGEYVVEAWHETFGAQRSTVRMEEGERKQIAFEFRS
jgi:hypothetical protein